MGVSEMPEIDGGSISISCIVSVCTMTMTLSYVQLCRVLPQFGTI